MNETDDNKDDILILVLDDNAEHLAAIKNEITQIGYRAISAEHGREGCSSMREQGDDVNVIILDREMPVMDGMEFIAWLKKNNFDHVPVIMFTKDEQPETITQGIDAGVFYYLTKPLQNEILHSVLNSAVTASKRHLLLKKEVTSHSRSIGLISKCLFYVKTLQDAESTACFAANFFPDPDRVLQGIAQLIINAVEHGNLGIGYEEKTRLLQTQLWREEIDKRQKLPVNINKKVTVYFEEDSDSYNIVIKDEGEGFNWLEYTTVSPARALHNHGRGIAQAQMFSFDKIMYNKKGNEVKAIIFKKNSDKNIDWD